MKKYIFIINIIVNTSCLNMQKLESDSLLLEKYKKEQEEIKKESLALPKKIMSLFLGSIIGTTSFYAFTKYLRYKQYKKMAGSYHFIAG